MDYLRAKSVAKKLDISISSVWRLTQKGILPQPRRLTPRTTVWCSDDVDAAIEKIAANGEGVAI